ncbi:hypothetical protein [Methylovorus glucosotrophus]|uniref:Uncharacterized protein n=1 Tax=Methylovorus glucosotrophus (strain SIP3-4) TaxID=582744 RepID=C6XEP0_METGS|nr:hypothetical protein [Methylovorus glucosotrophus]ACT52097.1 hypothetical protein Msip34_2873 [Methylovorus glucosotrophus SIP3-4]
MTGLEFETWIKRIGLKKLDVAKKLGVDPDTITAKCKGDQVPGLYAYALLGLASEKRLQDINELTEILGIIGS